MASPRAIRGLGALLLVSTLGCDRMAGESRKPEIRIATVAEEPDGPDLLTSASALERQATGLGLLGFDAQGQIAPALARSWNVSGDGLQYVFRLRPDTRWSDGKPLAAGDAARVLRSALRARAKNPLRPLLLQVDEVGAPAPSVIEIQLPRPAPALLTLLAHPAMTLKDVKRFATGPFRRASAQTSGSVLLETAAKSDVAIGKARITPLLRSVALARFRSGDLDVVTGARLPGLIAAREIGARSGSLRVEQALGYHYLEFGTAAGVLENVQLRAALSLALDRATIARSLFATPAFREQTALIPARAASPGGALTPAWTQQPLDTRRSAASMLGAEAGVSAATPVTLTIEMPEGDEFEAILSALATSWEPLGILVRARVRPAAEHAAFLAKRDFQLALAERVAPAPSASWFLDPLRCDRIEAWRCSAEADGALDLAQQSSRPADRAEAERLLLARVPIIPLFTSIRWSLVSPRWTGWYENDEGAHPVAALALADGSKRARK